MAFQLTDSRSHEHDFIDTVVFDSGRRLVGEALFFCVGMSDDINQAMLVHGCARWRHHDASCPVQLHTYLKYLLVREIPPCSLCKLLAQLGGFPGFLLERALKLGLGF